MACLNLASAHSSELQRKLLKVQLGLSLAECSWQKDVENLELYEKGAPSHLRGVSSHPLGRAHVRVSCAVYFCHIDLGIFHAVVLVS